MHEGYGDYIIGIFEPSFLSFLSPYYLNLRYVPCFKTTLRPWLHTLYLIAHTWAILEISWILFLRAWWMSSYDMIYTRVCPSYQWWIFRGDMIYTRANPAWHFLSGWCLALRHSQFTFSLGLWWIRSYGMALHWSIAIFKKYFYMRYNHSTRYSILGHIPLIDGWFFFRWQFILRYNPLINDGLWFILEHSNFRWFILGQFIHIHRALGFWFIWIHIHRALGFWFIWIMLRCFHF